MFPSGPAVIPEVKSEFVVYSVTVPPVVIFPILTVGAPLNSRNHNFPSGPTVISLGMTFAVGRGKTLTVPDSMKRSIELLPASVIQRLPSGPVTMPLGPEFGMAYSTMATLAETGTTPVSRPATRPMRTATPLRTVQHCQAARIKSTIRYPPPRPSPTRGEGKLPPPPPSPTKGEGGHTPPPTPPRQRGGGIGPPPDLRGGGGTGAERAPQAPP